ncbi:ABC transporter permease [Amylibacter marinus]|uniref:ABC transporter permease n=1 Tax=Amylibacter marinus TaxID=1475483 RepID=A0ABQ5VWB3_9RHOB|nr:ABC transporter permease [Amylibacter marinus]GLQ35489.1 ABC transporter permease [Amylibacter marinus]
MLDFLLQLLLALDATLRLATPLILCAMAGIFAERSGIVDISLEGKLLTGAFVAAAVAAITGSAWLGLFAAIGASVFMSLIHGFACITHKGDQVVSGVAINILASGMTVIAGIALFAKGGQTPHLPNESRFRAIEFYGVETLNNVPVIGTIYRELISGHSLLVYLALVLVPICAFVMYKSRFGLRLRAVGELPEAVDSAGISVTWLRYRALIVGGALCGIAGAYLSISHGANFVREMSAGKGYIALAAVIFGNWRPYKALFACLLFGFLEAGTSRLQGVDLPLIGEIPIQLMLAVPYIVTVLLLAGFIGRPTAPAAIGQPYNK